MSRASLTTRKAGDFIKLANVCGFAITAVDLAQLSRRKFLEPVEIDGDEGYVGLHLYVLAQYFEAVRPLRHPWATVPSERTLDQVGQLGRQVGALMEVMCHGRGIGADERDEATKLLIEMERFINEIDPFGPLGEIVDLMRPDVLRLLRGSGRLYAEIRGAAKTLAELLEQGEAEPESAAGPLTMEVIADGDDLGDDLRSTQVLELPMAAGGTSALVEEEAVQEEPVVDTAVEAKVVEESSVEAEEASKTPVDEERVEAVVEDEEPPTQLVEVDAALDQPGDVPFELRATQMLPPAVRETSELAEESSEPIMLLEDVVPGATATQFKRDHVEVTSRNEELAQRLHQLRQHDEAVATVREKVQSPESKGEDLVAKIAELNRLRETYLKAQAWQELADLYENGIGLFADAAERQQVFRVLGTLYETKLGREDLAMAAFERAFLLDGSPNGGRDAWEGLRRIGSREVHRVKFASQLESFLGEALPNSKRQLVQRTLALLQRESGEGQRAFFLYSSVLLNEPGLLEDPGIRKEFEGLLDGVDAEERQAFFEDLLGDEIDNEVRSWAESVRPFS